MDGDRIEGFKRFFEHSTSGGYALPGLRNKASLGTSLERQRGAEGGPVTPEDEELYMVALWTYLGYFKKRRTRILNPLFECGATRKEEGGFLFGHSISTDGYSVTLLVTNARTRGRKHFFASGASRRKRDTKRDKPRTTPGKDKDGFLKLSPSEQASNAVKAELIALGCHRPEDFLGGDPGKGVLLFLVDGKGNLLRYTGAQRRHETGASRLTAATRNARERVRIGDIVLPSRAQGGDDQGPGGRWRHMSAAKLEEEMRRRRLSAKTCDLRRMRAYVAFREASRPAMEAAYESSGFRARRFLAWCRRDATTTRLAEQILGKFGTPADRDRVQDDGVEVKQQRSPPVVILYGDWGRSPNLKHQAPTPGIGLRRRLDAIEGIVTVTVHESYTSSFCPNCQGRVEESRGQHGLLKCQDAPLCGTYWSRDMVGAMNIRAKGIHMWHHASPHPLFGG
jgi:Putative transposase DNA-binding domain.